MDCINSSNISDSGCKKFPSTARNEEVAGQLMLLIYSFCFRFSGSFPRLSLARMTGGTGWSICTLYMYVFRSRGAEITDDGERGSRGGAWRVS